ncbi:MAG TPA: NAD(P)H-hydrate dehydratase [Marmoricola sp.]|nr:NAD(P)H-hydrate dehydratase [Marmoricola sp.]
MRAAHSVEQVRAAEAELMARLPVGALMERAASGLAAALCDFLGTVYGARVLVLAGSGDNGGDALLAGALLARRGAAVEAVLLSDEAHVAGLAALRASGGRTVGLEAARRPDVVVDGIVGIGGRPGLRPDAVAALGRFPDVPVVAVDVPSGVAVDTGATDGPHVRADLTVTFGSHKVCHLVDPAASACGVVTLVDLGLDLPDAALTALQAPDVAALLPVPGPTDHKYTRGVVGVAAGSARYPGAAVLCTSGASSGLVGMVRYVPPAGSDGAVADAVRARHPGVVVGDGRVQAWVVGSGGGSRAGDALARALEDEVPVLVDADALQHFRGGRPDVVLTPHAGELGALLGVPRAQVEACQLDHARRAADRFGCVVLLKGEHSIIAAPDGRVRVNTSGTSWLATAGTGDVLAGITGSLLAAGLAPFDAAAVGAWLHGAAGTLASGGGPLTPEAVADAVSDVVRLVLRS